MAHLTNFSFEFSYKIFTEDAALPLLYHGAKKVKNDQKLKSKGGGSCLKVTYDCDGEVAATDHTQPIFLISFKGSVERSSLP